MARNGYNSAKENRERTFAVEEMHIKMLPELRQLIVGLADQSNQPMNEVIVQILASHFRRPELGRVPRRPMGRPRKELSAQR